MSLPTAYLTSTKRLSEIFDAVKTAKAPDKFTQKFLESLEFKSNGDRLIIGVLKALKLIDDVGQPTERYFKFLDQTQSAKVLAEAIEDAYSDLFAVNKNANTLTKSEIIGKLKTLSQGQYSDVVLDKMAMTFLALVSLADFASPKIKSEVKNIRKDGEDDEQEEPEVKRKPKLTGSLNLGGLVYNIQIVLPETRDAKVYEALFKALKDHLV
jgi:hypothetical protein